MKSVNFFEELEPVDDYWPPRVIGEVTQLL